MSRHRFRSQPALERSGGRTPSPILGLCLAAGIALGAGALVTTLYRSLAPDEPRSVTQADEPTRLGFMQPAPPMEPPAVARPPASAPAAPEPQASPTPSARVKAGPAPARGPHRAKPPTYLALQTPTPQQQWERQRLDYERARDVYDANERQAGYRWAQDNKIKVQRFCRAAQQRTPAFMEGCMSYLRTSETKGQDSRPAGRLDLNSEVPS
jgi:hypothetical protein